MATYDDLIRDLINMGRKDAVKSLGELYEANFGRLKDNVDGGKTAKTTAFLLNNSFGWMGTPQGDDYWRKIYRDLGKL